MKTGIKACNIYKHGDDQYSLTLNFHDCYISCDSLPWDFKEGNLSSACVRMLTVEDMYKLAGEIIKSANKARRLQDASNI